MIFFLIIVGLVAVTGLQIWEKLARENKRLGRNCQILVISITCWLAIAKAIADHPEKEAQTEQSQITTVSPVPSSAASPKPASADDPVPFDPSKPESEGTPSVIPHATSSSAEPSLTPCSSPVAVTPQEITARFWDSTINGHDASSYRAALKGVCVEWKLRFWSAERVKTDSDEMLISLTDAGKATHVYFRIPYKTYERFPLLGHDHLVHVYVKGQINRVDGQGIELTNATLDVVK